MKQAKIIKAYKAINKLYDQQLPLTISHKLWMLRQKLEPTWEFQVDKEQEVIMAYSPVIAQDGAVTFNTQEDSVKCREEYEKVCKEIADIDVDLGDFQKIQIKLDDKLEISIEDIEALEDFVDFAE